MVKSLREFEYFTVILKNRNFTSKIKRSKVTDYAALMSNGRLMKVKSIAECSPLEHSAILLTCTKR